MGLKMNGFWSTATLVALTAGLSAQTPAPQPGVATTQEKPTFKVQVDLVTSDIIVRDDKGNFVPDLKKDEFEIFEDGVDGHRPRYEYHFNRLHRVAAVIEHNTDE